MTWLSDIVKHLSVSKSFAGALFVTSFAILLGPVFAPELFDPVPGDWRWLVVAVSIFSFSLLAFWAVPPVFRGIISMPSRVRNSPRFNPPTDIENAFLYFLGKDYPNGMCDIDNIDNSNFSKLELLQVCKVLDRKGLVRIHPYDDDRVSLTDRGREHALQLAREGKT